MTVLRADFQLLISGWKLPLVAFGGKQRIRWSYTRSKEKSIPTLANDSAEETEPISLLCNSFALQRRNLLAEILASLPPFEYDNPSNEVLTQLLLHCDRNQ